MPLDQPLIDLTDAALARPLPEALRTARVDVLAAVDDLLAIPEDSLALPWAWIGGSEEEVRYGAYRAAEALEQAESEARSLVSPGAGGRAARTVAPATAARWDLHGLLVPLTDELLDADPGSDQWTVRQTVAHVISGQRGYGWGTGWWQANPHRPGDPDLPSGPPEAFWAGLPDDAEEGRGQGRELRARLDAILDLAAERLGGLPDDRLGLAARWSGFAVTVGFRLGRWSSHIREHTVQVEKTLALLGRVPAEPERLARLVLAAYGRAEAAVFALGPPDAVSAAAQRIAIGAAEAREAIAGARAAAG